MAIGAADAEIVFDIMIASSSVCALEIPACKSMHSRTPAEKATRRIRPTGVIIVFLVFDIV